MSDDGCSPIIRRRTRPSIPPGTPASASSQNLSGTPASALSCKRPKQKKKKKKVKQLHRLKRKNLRQARLNCKLLDHQAKERSDDEADNSEDDADASDDSIVDSNSSVPDGSPSFYALSLTSQAEAHGFTVPLHKVRHQDRPAIADQVLQRLGNKSKGFKGYLERIRDGVGQEAVHVLQLLEHPLSPSSPISPPAAAATELAIMRSPHAPAQSNLLPLFTGIVPETPLERLTMATGRLRLRRATCESNVQVHVRLFADSATQTEAQQMATLADLKAEHRALLLLLSDMIMSTCE